MRTTLMILAMVFGLGAVNAQTSSISHPNEYSTITTFYGSKASGKANNPCKGATTRKCGSIESSLSKEYVLSNSTIYREISVTKDASGNIIGTSVSQISLPSYQTLGDYITTRNFENGGSTTVTGGGSLSTGGVSSGWSAWEED